LGIRDFAAKNRLERAVVGLSGGIDSALTAVVAAEALGPDALTCVGMPSPYSSAGSLIDAKALAANLGAHWLELPIEPVMRAFAGVLAEPFAGTEPGLAEENVQARIRGTLLMALSNKFGDLVLATSNKSEAAVGYSTLYGDMAGGFAPIKDVGKLLVYDLCRHANRAGEVVPEAILVKPPSAELRPGQRDDDSLPPYEVLDAILTDYVELDRSIGDIIAEGFDPDTVRTVTAMVDRAEYKRRQSAPGIKITPRAFGKDRRLPITQRWTG
jgi:NAD+ synthase (glutamine-hydrolysing)